MSQQLVETFKGMEADKEAKRAEYVESGPVAQGYCDGYRSGVQDARLLVAAEEHPAVALLRRWEEAYSTYVVLANSMEAGRLINATREYLRDVPPAVTQTAFDAAGREGEE